MQISLHIRKRGTTYHYRRKIPAGISELFGAREVVRSLRTGQYHLACTRARSVSVICDKIFEIVNRMTLSKSEIDALLDKWLKDLFSEAKEEHSTRKYRKQDIEKDIRETHAEDYRQALTFNDTSVVKSKTDDFCKKFNIDSVQEPETYKYVSEGLLSRTAKYAVDIQELYEEAETPKQLEPAIEEPIAENAQLLSELWEPFLEHQQQQGFWANQHMSQSRATARIFIEVAGDKPVTQYSATDLTALYNTLRRLPSLYAKEKRFRSLPLHEVITNADALKEPVKRLCPTTVRRHFNTLSAFFEWPDVSTLNGSTTIFESFKMPKTGKTKTRVRDKRKMWTDENLKLLFASPIWTGCKNDTRRAVSGEMIIKDERYWIPIIGVLQGMRLEEICQLHLSDIKQEHDVWFFDINDEPPRQLKNAPSVRHVPVHKKLIELGFLKYLEKTKASKGKMVFPNLKPGGSDGKYSHYFTKQFGNYRKTIGVYEKLLDFHSFRHTAKTKLLNNDVEELITDELLGHENAKRGETNRYFKGYDLQKLKDAIDTIEVPFPNLI